jgi:hypothetical protein
MHNWSCKELNDIIHKAVLYRRIEVLMYLTAIFRKFHNCIIVGRICEG